MARPGRGGWHDLAVLAALFVGGAAVRGPDLAVAALWKLTGLLDIALTLLTVPRWQGAVDRVDKHRNERAGLSVFLVATIVANVMSWLLLCALVAGVVLFARGHVSD